MPKPAPLRLIKRCRLYIERGEWKPVPRLTRGVYVLYARRITRKKSIFDVTYIGVGGTGKNPTSGIGRRLRSHDKNKKNWTHYSFFEVHDNISREEILELESLFLRIFRNDSRVKLANVMFGSKVFKTLSKDRAWGNE
jgi:hypothetical protein